MPRGNLAWFVATGVVVFVFAVYFYPRSSRLALTTNGGPDGPKATCIDPGSVCSHKGSWNGGAPSSEAQWRSSLAHFKRTGVACIDVDLAPTERTGAPGLHNVVVAHPEAVSVPGQLTAAEWFRVVADCVAVDSAPAELLVSMEPKGSLATSLPFLRAVSQLAVSWRPGLQLILQINDAALASQIASQYPRIHVAAALRDRVSTAHTQPCALPSPVDSNLSFYAFLFPSVTCLENASVRATLAAWRRTCIASAVTTSSITTHSSPTTRCRVLVWTVDEGATQANRMLTQLGADWVITNSPASLLQCRNNWSD